MGDVKAGSSRYLPPDFYESYYSRLSKTWVPSPIHSLLDVEHTPGLLSVLAGKPTLSTFPIMSISMDVASPSKTSGELESMKLNETNLALGLQYGTTTGQTGLLGTLTEMQCRLHGLKRDLSWRISLGCGGTDMLYQALTTLTDAGDSVLLEGPTYTGALSMLGPLKADCVSVAVDGEGIVPSALAELLEKWPSDKKRPRYLYTVPYGGNPTGATAPTSRRREVLALARKYKFLIVEDDPYYQLYYEDDERPHSYLQLEAEDDGPKGLVLRIDSFSKVLSSGIRLGFATGPAPLLEKMSMLAAVAILQPPSISQSIVMTLLTNWGLDGFEEHCRSVSAFYRARRDTFDKAARKHLKDTGLADYTLPVSGLFFWIKLNIPSPSDDEEANAYDVIRTKAFAKGVLALPGSDFFADERKSSYVRASFSMLNEEDTEEAMRRLAEVVREARGETQA